jgi:glycine oxidase
MMEQTTDVAIIGGGISGCAIAYFLRKAGIDVTVFDQGEIGAEASSAAAGILAPLGSLSGPGAYTNLLLESCSLFADLIPELEATSGISVEYTQSGTLHIARGPHSIHNLRKRMQEWQPLGLELYWCDGNLARDYEPLLALDVMAAIYVPQDGQLKAPKLTRAYAQAAAALGAALRDHTEIVGVQRESGRVTGITTVQGETIACKHLVIAAGAWAARCGAWFDLSLPIVPQRGQILTLEQPEQPLRRAVFGEAIYFAPKQDNTVVVGATREEVGYDKRLTAGGISWLLSSAIRLAPSLEPCAIAQMWAGLRPLTPDHHPILGRAPGYENVTLAAGHSANGIMLSAITGKSIAELITTSKTPDVIKGFGIERFTA